MLSQVCALARGSAYSMRIMASVGPEVRQAHCQSKQGRRPFDLRLGQTMTIEQHRPSPSDNHVREWPLVDLYRLEAEGPQMTQSGHQWSPDGLPVSFPCYELPIRCYRE